MFDFWPESPDERELHQFFTATSRAIASQEKEVTKMVGQLSRSTAKMDSRLQKVKRQLVRDGILTPEQISGIEQKAAAKIHDF